jgi:hypothetical protein
MKNAVLLLGIIVTALAGPVHARTYSGTLSASDGTLVVQGLPWGSPMITPASLNWSVTEIGPSLWQYEYTLTVWAYSIGCVIIEASDGSAGPAFTYSDMSAATSNPPGWTDDISVGTHDAGSDNPGMPQTMHGIRFTSPVDPTTLTIRFNSTRRPVWGDFYARSRGLFNPATGQMTYAMLNYLYNSGFTANDTDPQDPPDNTSVTDHVLVPDTTSGGATVPVLVSFNGCDLVGAWVGRFSSPAETLIHTFTFSPLCPGDDEYLMVAQMTARAAAAREAFPNVNHLTSLVGKAVLSGGNKIQFTAIGYGSQLDCACDQPTYIAVMSGTLKPLDDGKTLTATASVSYYPAEQDLDLDGFPDTCNEMICLTYEGALKTVGLREPCQ